MRDQRIKNILFQPYNILQSENGVNVGYTVGWLMEEGFVSFFDHWVKEIDTKMDKSLTDPKLYQKLLGIRFVSFKEYQRLFNTTVDRDSLNRRAYRFFLLDNSEKVAQFISTKDTTVTDYIKTFYEWFGHQVKQNGAFSLLYKKLPVWIPYDEMKRHTYIVGQSGSGKSELIKLMFYSLQTSNSTKKTIFVIDPHGDLADEIKAFKLNHAQRSRVIFIDPSLDAQYTPVVNPFDIDTSDNRVIDILSQELVGVFQQIISDSSLSLQMEALLNPCIATLLRMGGQSLKDLQRFMDDTQNDRYIRKGMESPNLNHAEFFKYSFRKKAYSTTKQAIYTRIQSLLNFEQFSQLLIGKSTINLEDSINSGKIIIVSLPQGKMGSDASISSGKFLIALIQTYVLKRAYLQKTERVLYPMVFKNL